MGYWSNIGNARKPGAYGDNFSMPGVYEAKILSTMDKESEKDPGVRVVKAVVEIVKAENLPGQDSNLHPIGAEVEWFTKLVPGKAGKFRLGDVRAFIDAASGVDLDTIQDIVHEGEIVKREVQCEQVANLVWADDGAGVAGNIIQVKVVESPAKDGRMFYNCRFQHVSTGE